MANIRDITSTEKLLNVIRSRKEGPASPQGPNEPKDPRKGLFNFPLPSLPSMVSNQKTDTVGIDIGHDYLRMVRASGASVKPKKIRRRSSWSAAARETVLVI